MNMKVNVRQKFIIISENERFNKKKEKKISKLEKAVLHTSRNPQNALAELL